MSTLPCVLLLMLFAWNVDAEITLCSEEIIGRRLCTHVEDYDTSLPPKPHPFFLKEKVTIYDIPEFNQDDGTVTIFMKIAAFWNDTRVTLVSSDPSQ